MQRETLIEESKFVRKIQYIGENFYLADVIESYHFVSKQCEPEFRKNSLYT